HHAALAATVSAKVAGLAQGAIKAMLFSKLKNGLAVVITVLLVGGMGTWLGLAPSQEGSLESSAKAGGYARSGPAPKNQPDSATPKLNDAPNESGPKEGDPPDESTDNKDSPKPVSPEIIAAWHKAGARVGWISTITDENSFASLLFAPEKGSDRA